MTTTFIQEFYIFLKLFRVIKKMNLKCVHLKCACEYYFIHGGKNVRMFAFGCKILKPTEVLVSLMILSCSSASRHPGLLCAVSGNGSFDCCSCDGLNGQSY